MTGASAAASTTPARMPAARAVAASGSRALDTTLMACLFLVPLTKLYVDVGGKIELAYAAALAWIVGFLAFRVARRDFAIPRPALVLLGFQLASMAVWAAGYVGLDTALQRTQLVKGFAFATLHGVFMVCIAAHLARGGLALVRRATLWLVAGFAFSGAWGVLQMVAHVGGVDLDQAVLGRLPIIADTGSSLIFYGTGVLRTTGMTLDTNHLGVLLVVPIALGLAMMRGWVRIAVVGTCVAALVLTLSRSGALGVVGALAWMAWHRRSRLLARGVALPVGVLVVLSLVGVQALVVANPELARSLIFSRLDVNAPGAQEHLQLYSTIPGLLAQNPLFGIGLNNFALHFVDTSGRADFGPHSAYIKLIVETGLAGVAVFVLQFGTVLGWLRSSAAAAVDARLALGLGAAIFGTLVGNLFYLTMHFMYDEVLLGVAAALIALAPAAPND